MIKKNMWKMIIASIAIILPGLLGLFLINQLSVEIPGLPQGLIWLPLVLVAFQWLCAVFSAKDVKGEEQNAKVFNVVIWIIPVLSWFSCGIIYATALGVVQDLAQYSFLLFGLIFVVLGNYLPKCKQSFTTGIKIKWTLSNEENWYATHRLAGKIWVICGFLSAACVCLPMEIGMIVMFTLIFFACLIPTVYSYKYYKKQVAEGRAPEKVEVAMSKDMKRARNVILAVVGVLLAGLMIFIFVFAGFKLEYADTSFTINATGWEDTTVRYADIERIEYLESCEAGMRTYGFGDVPMQMGIYTNDAFGSYTRYGYAGCDAAVVLTVDGQILVITGKDTAATQAIYNELMSRK